MTDRSPEPEEGGPSDSLAFAALGLIGLVVLSLLAALIDGCSRTLSRDCPPGYFVAARDIDGSPGRHSQTRRTRTPPTELPCPASR
jgi:hypothetical protein